MCLKELKLHGAKIIEKIEGDKAIWIEIKGHSHKRQIVGAIKIGSNTSNIAGHLGSQNIGLRKSISNIKKTQAML